MVKADFTSSPHTSIYCFVEQVQPIVRIHCNVHHQYDVEIWHKIASVLSYPEVCVPCVLYLWLLKWIASDTDGCFTRVFYGNGILYHYSIHNFRVRTFLQNTLQHTLNSHLLISKCMYIRLFDNVYRWKLMKLTLFFNLYLTDIGLCFCILMAFFSLCSHIFLVLRDHGVYTYVVYIWKWSSAHALGGVRCVATFITTDEQLQ